MSEFQKALWAFACAVYFVAILFACAPSHVHNQHDSYEYGSQAWIERQSFEMQQRQFQNEQRMKQFQEPKTRY